MENKSVNIKVGGRFYPLSIPSEEEEILRDLEKKVEGMIKKFEANYAIKDKQDALALCILQLDTNVEVNKQKYDNIISASKEKVDHLLSLFEED